MAHTESKIDCSNEYNQSEQIYQAILKCPEKSDEVRILDILDSVDPDCFDFANVKILHMFYKYITIKCSIKEFTFIHVLNKMKNSAPLAISVYNIIVYTIIKNIMPRAYASPNINFAEMNTDDYYFRFLVAKFRIETLDSIPTFDNYINEIRTLHKEITYHLSSGQDTDFLQISFLKTEIETDILRYVDEKEYCNIEPNRISTKIKEISKSVDTQNYIQTAHLLDQFKKTYGTERSFSYIDSLTTRLQFLSEPSHEHTIKYYEKCNDALQPLVLIPKISEWIKCANINLLISCANKLRRIEQYDQFNKLLIRIKHDIKSLCEDPETTNMKYREYLEYLLNDIILTYNSQYTRNSDQYYQYIVSLIQTNNHIMGINPLVDMISIIYPKKNYHEIISLYEKYQSYFHFKMKKTPDNDVLRCIVMIITSYYITKRINTITIFDDLLRRFGLNIYFFKSKVDDPMMNKINKTYDFVSEYMTKCILLGYKVEDTNAENNAINCAFCGTCIDTQFAIIQCTKCAKHLHLMCLSDKIDKNKQSFQPPCCT